MDFGLTLRRLRLQQEDYSVYHMGSATYDRDNQLVLLVEVKSKLGAPPEWAARLRRHLLAHGTCPNAQYFPMVFPDRFYL